MTRQRHEKLFLTIYKEMRVILNDSVLAKKVRVDHFNDTTLDVLQKDN